MSVFKDPFIGMSIINVCSGMFSAIAGLWTAFSASAPIADWEEQQPASPWRYFIGGSIAALVGVGNWFHLTVATWGTIAFIATSIYDGWFGAGSKDWRFFTLTAYILVQTLLLLWALWI